MRIKINHKGFDYEIDVTEDSYNLIKLGKITDEDSKNFGNTTEQVIGYFTTVSSALNKVIKIGFSKEGSTVSLSEYIKELDNAINSLKQYDKGL